MHSINDFWLSIMENAVTNVEVDAFNEWFVLLENYLIPREMWHCFARCYRTNNATPSWNEMKMKSRSADESPKG